MSEHTYKMIELVGSSHTGIEAAVQNAIAKAEINESKMRWFEVMETVSFRQACEFLAA